MGLESGRSSIVILDVTGLGDCRIKRQETIVVGRDTPALARESACSFFQDISVTRNLILNLKRHS